MSEHPPVRAVLISPGALDGYPPVQHQARLFARAGFHVSVVTPPLSWVGEGERFQEPGVIIHELPLSGSGRLAAARRAVALCRTICRARPRAGECAVEIAYDPDGMLYSDLTPFRPKLRIAHFHESLQRFPSSWLERRLVGAVPKYDRIVVADQQRALLLKEQLALPSPPTAVPNYPMVAPPPERKRRNDQFEIIYCGSVGLHQKLDSIIASAPSWPNGTVFTIIGNDHTEIGRQLKAQVLQLGVAERVRFEGWLPYERLRARLSQADLAISLLEPALEQWRTALGASNKRYQYMQAGLPQIGDMNPGVPELIEGQSVGRCVRSFAPEEIGRIITDYVSQPARRSAEGKRAYALHRSAYNYERAFAPVLDWIEMRLAQGASTT